MNLPSPPQLSSASSRQRQARLQAYMLEKNLDAVLFTHRHYVYWLSAYWHEQILTPCATLFLADGTCILVTHSDQADALAADEILSYEPQKLCTLVENLDAALCLPLIPYLEKLNRIGVAGNARPWLAKKLEWVDITLDFQYLRRKKDGDEIDAIRHTIQAADAVYTKAKEILQPGISEIELYAQLQATAIEAAGDLLSGWGNDFQSGTPGGLARQRAAQAGELLPFDIGVGVRGYRSDLCRTFSVDGQPTDLQQAAHQRVVEMLEHIEARLQPGLSCRTLFEHIQSQLDGWKGYQFKHHLGHGIGLDPHEVPRLNPCYDDTLQPGDLIAIEPGIYGDELKAGIRLEQNYLITDSGYERLSNFPLDL
ncbi:MAG: Xaa-Pro peptidase family protein [Verrucomicrobiales bacterium]|nr:Xaa-Pro peptidase family protein [Verrucomicrobiales bacterium]